MTAILCQAVCARCRPHPELVPAELCGAPWPRTAHLRCPSLVASWQGLVPLEAACWAVITCVSPGPRTVPGATWLLLQHLLTHGRNGGTRNKAAALLIQIPSAGICWPSLLEFSPLSLSSHYLHLGLCARSTSFRKPSLSFHPKFIFSSHEEHLAHSAAHRERNGGPGAHAGRLGLERHLPAWSSSFPSHFLSFSSCLEISRPGMRGRGLAPSQPTLEGDLCQMLMLNPNVGT